MARAPRDGTKVTLETAAMMVLAAKELNTTVAAMTERACRALLKHEARELFRREFDQANQEAADAMQPTVPEHEFAARWKPPAWKP